MKRPSSVRDAKSKVGKKYAAIYLTDTDYNIYYCEGNPELGKTMLEKQQGDGVDSHSLAVDPLFVDPEQGDFRFKPDSPALKLGFVPFDMSKVGLIENLATD